MPTFEKSQLQLNNFQLLDEIFFPTNHQTDARLNLKQIWEKVALQWEQTAASIETPREIWDNIPTGKHFDSILDLGCGYGRHAAYLSKQKEITCNQYYGIDISENMLRRMLTFNKAYNLFSSPNFALICMQMGELPFEDNSIEFIISSSVFLHLEKQQLTKNLAEIARVIKPGGVFIFEDLFYNRYCPANIRDNVLRKVRKSGATLADLKQYSLREINWLLKNSQLSQKCPEYTIKPHKSVMLAEQLRGVEISATPDIDREMNPSKFLKGLLASGYCVYSKG
ncbi:class I SAM-dependent methyltransferase [Coleofasciculus sp. FACHB-1120]|uniref:class I SAM-dependent methyltransferase n=1 Tax=Coleofasciculus sp. FACHB-1120 TaxID=2692783 RepID=UPI00168595CA|nr:class I SAM-dependent methyltransferase [Coleofasciculus sp. FACHB-1120]MBD2742186.1 class I SAM-dependent methyltransferase [Coleofasciculus sp. FACHB-1120]